MSIKEQFKKLIELQTIDSQIYKLRITEQGEIPEQIRQYDQELVGIKNQLTEAEEQLKTLQLEKKNKELDLQTKENNVQKFQLQLLQVKTNKEYASLEKEIEGLKADNSLLEEEIIHLLDKIDAVTGQVGRERKRFDEESKRIQQRKEELNQQLEVVKKEKQELEMTRHKMIEQIDPLILPRYEQVLRLRQGVAVVPIKDGSCQGCFMHLPPQVINLVQGQEDWIICEQCARILYIEEEISG